MKKAKSVIYKIQKFTGKKLSLPDELELIIDGSIRSDKTQILKEISFTAKYLTGLERIMQSNISFTNLSTNGTNKINNETEDKVTEDAMERIKREYKDNFIKLTTQLEDVINTLEEKDKNFFKTKYLSLNPASLNYMRELISDLSIFKRFINEYPAEL